MTWVQLRAPPPRACGWLGSGARRSRAPDRRRPCQAPRAATVGFRLGRRGLTPSERGRGSRPPGQVSRRSDAQKNVQMNGAAAEL
jgi:hypothetical protein